MTRFAGINVSQGSAATFLKRFRFDRIVAIESVAHFFGSPCISFKYIVLREYHRCKNGQIKIENVKNVKSDKNKKKLL